MNRLVNLLLTSMTVLSLASCGGNSSSNKSENAAITPPNNNTNATIPPSDNTNTTIPPNGNNTNQTTPPIGNNTNSSNQTNGANIGDYQLPPMPDKSINDSTLLGVDSNDNGIRDDVEHYIDKRFKGYKNAEVERQIAMQWAKRAQLIIQSPETAYEDKKYELTDRALNCEWYYYDTYLENIKDFPTKLKFWDQHDIFNAEFKDKVFNTRQRLKAYFRYNESMSGHVFWSRPHTKDNCDFNPDPLIEGRL